jgi:hypothetical protein
VRRALAAIAVLLLSLLAGYWFGVRDTTVTARVHAPQLTSTIGSGSEAVGVSSTGEIISFIPIPKDQSLPRLSLAEVPKSGHLAGPVLEQAKVIGAAPSQLRPYVERSYLGESGIDVDLTSGIELRFGDASQAAKKWKAAAAILADPEITALDYVDLRAPGHPAWGGEGHSLPPAS